MIGALGAALTMAGCADGVIFVTKTSLSIVDADSTPPGISVAYDRVEGYLGPTNESGEAPAVLGYYASDGQFFRPNVRQVYATGNAARLLSAEDKEKAVTKCSPERIENEGRVMFFGTATTTGLKIGFSPNAPVPDSLLFGWRRKEVSTIPLSKAVKGCVGGANVDAVREGQRFYPATLGAIRTAIDSTRETGRMNTYQFFATGDAAVNLARQKKMTDLIDIEINVAPNKAEAGK